MKSDLIAKITSFRTRNKFEKKGIARDLEIIWQKLEKGEYEKGFIPVNKFDVPSRTEAIYREVEFLMQLGHDWERILRALPLNSFSRVVDLCPGYTPKIELGLYFLHYKGKVHILDKDRMSVNNLERFIGLFNPEFRIVKRHQDLFKSVEGSYDLVLGNHIVDDLTVYYFSKKAGISLSKFYANEEAAQKVWRNILAKKSTSIDDISERIADVLDKVTGKGGYLCLSQYKSYSEKLFDMQEAYNFNKAVFKKIRRILINRGFVSKEKLLTRAFNGYKGHFGKEDCVLLQKK